MIDNHDNIFNTNSIFAILVVARLIRDAHANFPLDVISPAYTDRSLMATVETTYTMTSTMLVLKTHFPKMLSGQDVHIFTGNALVFGPDESFYIKDS
jgi:hypothetical protein